MAERRITGKQVLIGFVAAFGVIVGVNIALAVSAVMTGAPSAPLRVLQYVG